jgi:D-alanine-D-alanine ligase
MVSKIINLPHNRPLIAKANRHNHTLPRKVAILYSYAKREFYGTYQEYLTDKGARIEAMTFVPYLKKLGVKTCLIPATANMVARLKRAKPDMAINLVTTVKGYDYLASSVPAALELLEIPYTGSTILGFALGCNKYLIYSLMEQHGIPVPRFQLMGSATTPLDPTLRFPLILKLNEEHSNIAITVDSVVENEFELRKRLRYLLRTFDEDVLVSEFVDGREFAAFIFQSYNRKVYLLERKFLRPTKNGHRFLDFDTAWLTDGGEYDRRIDSLKYHDRLLAALAKKAFVVTKMDDYGKFDIRRDRMGNYYFIDANCNCHFAPPDISEFAQTMKMHGVPFKKLLKRLLQNTMREWGY